MPGQTQSILPCSLWHASASLHKPRAHAACARPALRGRIKSEFDLPRYKLVVQVLIGEQRGEGIRYGGRCLWDPNTDAYAEDTYRNDSLFCVASAYGVYLY